MGAELIITETTLQKIVRNYVIKEIGIPEEHVGEISPRLEWYGYGNECDFTGVIVKIKE